MDLERVVLLLVFGGPIGTCLLATCALVLWQMQVIDGARPRRALVVASVGLVAASVVVISARFAVLAN